MAGRERRHFAGMLHDGVAGIFGVLGPSRSSSRIFKYSMIASRSSGESGGPMSPGLT
jgi:hypothetical protein